MADVANKNGFLRDIDKISVGGGIAVGVPMNDPVKVAGRVEINFGVSGLAGALPFGFGYQGERYSLNDYDGNKNDIVPDRYAKMIWKLREIQQIARNSKNNTANKQNSNSNKQQKANIDCLI
uniref:Ntox44 domain-containing protein n=1 Tax=Syphacia muris TaxID=451379 RepID=A0A0N5AIR6_9BILA